MSEEDQLHFKKKNDEISIAFKTKFGFRLFRVIQTSLLIMAVLVAVFAIIDVGLGMKISKELRRINYSCEFRDPTYREMKEFLARDLTDSKKYISSEFNIKKYTCRNFAVDVRKNAIKNRIRCAIVLLKFQNGRSHAIIAFRIVDGGVIFIEPQSDKEVSVIVGQYYCQIWDYYSMGVIKSIKIYWPEIKK